MQIVTWPWGKAALNIIKRRQQKKTRRHDTGNVFSLLVSSGRSGMIECWCLPGPLQRRSSTPPSAHTHTCTASLMTCTNTCVRAHTHTHRHTHTYTHSAVLFCEWQKYQGVLTVIVSASLRLSFWSREYFKVTLYYCDVCVRTLCVCVCVCVCGFLHGRCVS